MTSPAPDPSSPNLALARALFEAALDRPSEEREDFVRRQTGGNPQLREQVLALLAQPSVDTQQLAAPIPQAHEGEAPGADQVRPTATGELLRRLGEAPRLDPQRFTLEGKVDQGGMGAILRLHDSYLHRRVAMKVQLERQPPRDEEQQKLANQLLGRFLEEAQVTSQLDHPGVVPVHDLGLDATGKVWFTMRLVKGRNVSAVFADAHAGRDDWTRTRALEVVLKVCDTMAYAHDKGVLHRDLKPKNVMVGRFGEVYVMDWGLAKVLGQPDRHDLRIRPASEPPASNFATERQRDTREDASSSLVSMDGQHLGTPNYMPPEQAHNEALDGRADVYAIGAMIYELLAGRAPYAQPGRNKHAHQILDDLRDGPPKRLEELAPGVPAELVAIVDKAMARDREARYRTVVELAADLRAFLDNRVVKAHKTGALVEMKLWMRRNRAHAITLITAIVLQAAGIVGALVLWYWADHHKGVAQVQNTLLAAESKKNAIFADVAKLAEAKRLEAELYPAFPDKIPAMEAWLRDFGEPLAAHLPKLEQELAALRAKAKPTTDEQRRLAREQHPSWRELERRRQELLEEDDPADRDKLREQVATLQNEIAVAGLEFDQGADAFLHRTLTRLVEEQGAFVRDGVLPKLQQRLAAARTVEQQTIDGYRQQWDKAIADIKASNGESASTLYDHFALTPQVGLVPIGRDPESKLWEFVHLASGTPGKEIPQRDPATGRVVPTGDMGIVFVLLPGGTLPDYEVAEDAAGERKRRSVRLDPFFLGKYEVTQGQWQRLTGRVPTGPNGAHDPALPVAKIDWFEAEERMRHHGFELPSELRWEYAIRAGTKTLWWTGDDEAGIEAMENIGSGHPQAVGSRSDNPFGLFDMGGNVMEWCLDQFADYGTERGGDGVRHTSDHDPLMRCHRGGRFVNDPDRAQSGYRVDCRPSEKSIYLGLRAARAHRR